MTTLTHELHKADHFDTPEQAEVAARTKYPSEVRNFDYKLQCHREGYIVKLIYPFGKRQSLGYLTDTHL